MNKRAGFRNEVKTRLGDREYAALQLFKQMYHLDSDSSALARVVQICLLGYLDGMEDVLKRVQELK